MAGNFPWRADPHSRRRDAGHGVDSGKLFCLAGFRSLPRSVGATMASWLGAGFARSCRSVFPYGWNCEFWICDDVWFAFAKNVERRHRAIFSILAAKLRLVGSLAGGSPLRRIPDLQLPGLVTRPQSCGWIPRSSMDGRI